MKVRYFADTDTLFIEFREALVAETRDLDENTVLDVDAQGNICSITVEHASLRAGAPTSPTRKLPLKWGADPATGAPAGRQDAAHRRQNSAG